MEAYRVILSYLATGTITQLCLYMLVSGWFSVCVCVCVRMRVCARLRVRVCVCVCVCQLAYSVTLTLPDFQTHNILYVMNIFHTLVIWNFISDVSIPGELI